MTSDNAEQIKQWDGAVGEHWVAEADRYDRMIRPFGEQLLATAAPRAGDRVLDVGCGNGALALAVAREIGPDGSVHGLDISGPMLAEARRRAEAAGANNAMSEHGDAQVHPLAATFDLVASRFGVMFFADPLAAFTNLAGGLRPGGRLAFSCRQEVLGQEWIMVPAVAALEHVPVPSLGEPGPGPFSLADRDSTAGLLHDAGFDDIEISELVAPMWMGASVADALGFMRSTDFAEVMFADVAPEAADAAWDAIAGVLEPHAGNDGVALNGAAWLVTARRPA